MDTGSVPKGRRKKLKSATGFPVALLLFVVLGLAALPLVALAIIALMTLFDGEASAWPHLLRHVLPATAWDTVILLGGVAVCTTVLGAGTAWLTTMMRFPGQRIFAWALVLPLAVPTYIAAYTQVEFFDFSGPVQTAVRGLFGFQSGRDYWFFDIRSLPGAIFTFSLVLYPYVFLPSRLVFGLQGASALDVCRSLGANGWRQFMEVGMPMARPAIIGGVTLALMETLNDVGAVEALGVKTISYAVFETWLNRDSLGGAVQLAVLTLMVVAGLIYLERWARRHRSYASNTRDKPPSRVQLRGWRAGLATTLCALPLLGGLGVPLAVLVPYASRRLDGFWEPQLWAALTNSLTVALLTACLCALIGYGLLQYARLARTPWLATAGRMAGLGYAVPGTVLAVGLLVPLAGFDNALDSVLRDTFGISTGLLFSGSIIIVIYACSLRFFTISYATLEAGFGKISPSMDMAALALGRKAPQVARDVHRPMMQRAVGIALLLVFVDAMKELSATLLLRPFNFETLATMIYARASQAALEDAAMACLIILLIGLVPVFLLARMDGDGSANADKKKARP